MTGDPAPIVIRSDRLSVEVAHPGAAYRRTRFDWTGWVTQVTLDGARTFCSVEDPDPNAGSGGVGLCGEFGIERPVGYDDAQPGECFPKLGVGLLRRRDAGAYNFFLDHEIEARFPFTVASGADWVAMTAEPIECRGYAARTSKTIRVEGAALEIREKIENTGQKDITTHEYYHNFIAVDRQPVGPAYVLRFPYDVRYEDMTESYRAFLPPVLQKITPRFVLKWLIGRRLSAGLLETRGKEITWKATPTMPFYNRPVGFFKTTEPQWTLTHAPSGAWIREVDSFDPARVAVWGVGHVVSAEVFVDIHVRPGETQEWTRRYEFGAP